MLNFGFWIAGSLLAVVIRRWSSAGIRFSVLSSWFLAVRCWSFVNSEALYTIARCSTGSVVYGG
jgi:hypothetical protein